MSRPPLPRSARFARTTLSLAVGTLLSGLAQTALAACGTQVSVSTGSLYNSSANLSCLQVTGGNVTGLAHAGVLVNYQGNLTPGGSLEVTGPLLWNNASGNGTGMAVGGSMDSFVIGAGGQVQYSATAEAASTFRQNAITLSSSTPATIGAFVNEGVVGGIVGSGGIVPSASGIVISNKMTVTTLDNRAGAQLLGVDTGSALGVSLGASGAGKVGTLNNAGTIQNATGYSINVEGAGASIGTINNSSTGTIGGMLSVSTGGSIGTINNDKLIQALHPTNRAVIQISSAGSSIGALNNNSTGTIDGTIILSTNATLGTLSNRGSITNGAGNAIAAGALTSIGQVDNAAGGTIQGRVHVSYGGAITTLSNAGSITNASTPGSEAIWVTGNTGAVKSRIDTLDNTGTITGQVLVDAGGTITTLSNAGTLQASVAGGAGDVVKVSASDSSINTLANASTGSITGRVIVQSGGAVTALNNGGNMTNNHSEGIAVVGTSGGVKSRIGTLDNTGTITGLVGVKVDAGGTITTLNNRNVIQALNPADAALSVSAAGTSIGSLNNTSGSAINGRVAVTSGGAITTLDNRGTITATKESVWVTGGSAITTLGNSGTIVATTAGADAVQVKDGSSRVDTLENTGTITGAVNVMSSGLITKLDNRATLESSAASGNAVSVSGSGSRIAELSNTRDIKGLISISSTGVITKLDNSGTLQSTNATGNAITVGAGTAGARLHTLNNTGDIQGLITVASGGGISALNNSGRLLANAAGNSIQIDATAASGATVINNLGGGTIAGKTVLNAAAVLNNHGTINNTVALNNGTLNLEGSNARVTALVSGNASSTVNVNGSFSSEGAFGTGTFQIASGGVFNMRHDVTATAVAGFRNAGTLGLTPTQTVTLTGAYTQDANGVLRTAVASDTNYGKIVVNGAATLPSNARIDVDVTTPNYSFTSDRLADVLKATTLNSDGSFKVTDNSLLFDFKGVKNGNSVDLLILPAGASDGPGVLKSVVVTGNNPAVGAARVLDAVIAANAAGELARAFIPLTGERQVSDAVSQTLPLLTGGSMIAATSAFTGINRVVQARIEANRGLSSGEDFLGDRKVWMKPFGSWAEQGDIQGVAGYKSSTYGFALGADATVSPRTRVGAAFAYANSAINGSSRVAPQRNTVDVYQLIAYGSHSLDEHTELSWQADAGQNKNKGSRTIALTTSTASASYDSLSAHVGAGIGRVWRLSGATSVTPSVRADYTWIEDAAYRESGAGALNLNVGQRSTDMLVLSLGGKLSHELSAQTTLLADASAGYDTLNRQAAITAAFAGAPGAAFVTYGLTQDPWIGRAGLGLVHKTAQGVELTARYDAETRTSFLNQTASLKLRWNF